MAKDGLGQLYTLILRLLQNMMILMSSL